MIDPEFEMYLKETFADNESNADIESSTRAMDDFFNDLGLQCATGGGAQSSSQSTKNRAFDELREFVKSEKRTVEQRGITKSEVKASLAALRSILGRVVESV